jgi:hypothetical protein
VRTTTFKKDEIAHMESLDYMPRAFTRPGPATPSADQWVPTPWDTPSDAPSALVEA